MGAVDGGGSASGRGRLAKREQAGRQRGRAERGMTEIPLNFWKAFIV